MGSRGAKARHLGRDPRATVLVAEQRPPYRALEARGRAELLHDTCLRSPSRSPRATSVTSGVPPTSATTVDDDDVVLRVIPSAIRAWDFADEY
jgi:hypothetical protein